MNINFYKTTFKYYDANIYKYVLKKNYLKVI